MGTQAAAISFLGSHWCPAASPEQECHGAGTVWAREAKGGSSQTSLKHQQISYAGLTPSSSGQKLSSSLLQFFLHFGSLHFSPWVSFAHTALCGGEVQTHRLGTCPWIVTFFPSVVSCLGHIIFFIYICVRYHYIPSSSSICYSTEHELSFLGGDSLFLNYLGNPTLHLFHLLLFLSIPMHNGIYKTHWCCLWCWFFPRITFSLCHSTWQLSATPQTNTGPQLGSYLLPAIGAYLWPHRALGLGIWCFQPSVKYNTAITTLSGQLTFPVMHTNLSSVMPIFPDFVWQHT